LFFEGYGFIEEYGNTLGDSQCVARRAYLCTLETTGGSLVEHKAIRIFFRFLVHDHVTKPHPRSVNMGFDHSDTRLIMLEVKLSRNNIRKLRQA
jgi:hypothetical protein